MAQIAPWHRLDFVLSCCEGDDAETGVPPARCDPAQRATASLQSDGAALTEWGAAVQSWQTNGCACFPGDSGTPKGQFAELLRESFLAHRTLLI